MEATLPGLLISKQPNMVMKCFFKTEISRSATRRPSKEPKKIAAFLQSSCQVKAKDNVAPFLGNELDYLVLFMGIQRAGAVAVTINNLLKKMKLRFSWIMLKMTDNKL